jgi:hypothetical protein
VTLTSHPPYNVKLNNDDNNNNNNNKAIQLQNWRGLEGSRRLKLPDFKTIDT